MTDSSDRRAAPPAPSRRRPAVLAGLEGVLAGETALSKVDGANGRLTYRGYRIGDLVEHGTYPAVANLLWTGDWDPDAPTRRRRRSPTPSSTTLRALPDDAKPMDALRTAVSAWGATQNAALAADRRAGPGADRVLAVRAGRVRPDPRGQGADRARSVARPRRGLPLPAQGRAAGRRRPRGRSMPTSSSAPSTASTPRRSRPGSSPRRCRTSRRRSPARSGR